MKKVLLMIMILIMGTLLTFSAIKSDILYDIRADYIELTEMAINIKEEDEYVLFSKAMNNLRDEMKISGETGAAKTSIYFENEKDRVENILRVDIDFTGNTLEQPVNTMFVMDQSGSMNMTSGVVNNRLPVTPCLHADHGYLIKIKIDEIVYNYYHFPSESEWTGEWWTEGAQKVTQEAKERAIEQGIATAKSKVAPVYSTFFQSGSQFQHYDYVGTPNMKTIDKFYIEKPVTEADLEKQLLEKSYFAHIDREIFHKVAIDQEVWEFYSPVAIDTSIPAADYVTKLNENNECYDRMAVSKAVFHELSEVALTNSSNNIGYANFAGTLHSSQSLGEDHLVKEFLNTTGTRNTYYGKGLDFAKDEFTEVDKPHSGNQNLLIFVTDGSPNGPLNTVEEMDVYMSEFIKDTNAIVYFIGIDIPDSLFNTWGNSMATIDSSGIRNKRNSRNVAELLSVQAELKKILTSTTNISTNINSDFYMVADNSHPIEVTYTLKDSEEVYVETATSIDELGHLGITYDQATGHVNWNAGNRGISSARLTFYKRFDEEKVDWDKIRDGETLTGTSLGVSGTGYIDYSGREKEILMDDTATYIIEKSSELRIENETFSDYYVEVGQQIDYKITVINEGVLPSDNNFVYQKIPEGTEYVSSQDGIYYEEKNLLKFDAPEIRPGEEREYYFSVEATEYDFEIVSQARLGVYDESVTLDDEGVPILAAEMLYHHTPIRELPTNPEDLANTGDIGVTQYVNLATTSFMAILLLIYSKKKGYM